MLSDNFDYLNIENFWEFCFEKKNQCIINIFFGMIFDMARYVRILILRFIDNYQFDFLFGSIVSF